ncbi:hypothetical protein [Fodinibius saliphilus]|uniref:hypothetical protein n=1 Tax=Fodinibius saliphilus TaxID=1920650 RepID=UPI0011088CD9|nr:hypothetical protein [Fodinibius saliphilus]
MASSGEARPLNARGSLANLLAPTDKPERLRGTQSPCAGLGHRLAGRLKIWDSSSHRAAASAHWRRISPKRGLDAGR